MKVEIWTDGSCAATDQVGGWAAVIMVPGSPFIDEISGYEIGTTSQRMELTAALKSILYFTEPAELVIHSDSAYLVNCIQQKWMTKWRESKWISSKGTPVKNRELWEDLHDAIEFHTSIEFVKVKGHADIEFNERVDKLAGKARAEGLKSVSSV